MLSYEQLDEIKARASKATPGPWVTDNAALPYKGPFTDNGAAIWQAELFDGKEIVAGGQQDEQGGAVGILTNDDADFIAHARTDIPDLIAALEAAERERDACAGLASQAVSDMATAQNRVTALEQERDALKAENARFRSGLNTLAHSYYKGDQHQDYARHVLELKP